MVKKYKNVKKEVSVVDSASCRICQTISREALVSPCNCRGSLRYVHINCLQEWINTTNKTSCELCCFQFKVVQARRYKCRQSLCVWLFLPTVRNRLKTDCIFLFLLTIITSVITFFCYFLLVSEKNRNEIWPKVTVGLILLIVLCWYFREVMNLVKSNVQEWRLWWHSCVITKVVIEEQNTPAKIADEACRSQSIPVENATEHETLLYRNILYNHPSSSSSASDMEREPDIINSIESNHSHNIVDESLETKPKSTCVLDKSTQYDTSSNNTKEEVTSCCVVLDGAETSNDEK